MTSIIGQDSVLTYISSGIAKKILHPSLLFVGADGVGKKKVALEIVAEHLSQGNKADVLLINRDFQAALLKEKVETQTAIKIETVRHADNFLHLKSMVGATRVVVIEEANKLTNEAANALLKLLEEPPPQAQIILLTNDEHSLLPTVVSRCAVLRFRLIVSLEIARWLVHEKGVAIDEAENIASRAGGSFQHALELLEEEEDEVLNVSELTRREFFEALNETGFKKDQRKKARELIDRMLLQAEKKILEDPSHQSRLIESYLKAKKQIDHHVSPKLVLESLYMTYEKILSNDTTLLR